MRLIGSEAVFGKTKHVCLKFIKLLIRTKIVLTKTKNCTAQNFWAVQFFWVRSLHCFSLIHPFLFIQLQIPFSPQTTGSSAWPAWGDAHVHSTRRANRRLHSSGALWRAHRRLDRKADQQTNECSKFAPYCCRQEYIEYLNKPWTSCQARCKREIGLQPNFSRNFWAGNLAEKLNFKFCIIQLSKVHKFLSTPLLLSLISSFGCTSIYPYYPR